LAIIGGLLGVVIAPYGPIGNIAVPTTGATP